MQIEHTDTQLPRESEYPKLVRDRIPQIILDKEGTQVSTRILSDDKEYARYLRLKVVEEAEELRQASSRHNVAEEIADIYEVIGAILELYEITPTEIHGIQMQKRTQRGGFSRRLLMEMPAR